MYYLAFSLNLSVLDDINDCNVQSRRASAYHNCDRAEVDVPALQWCDDLANQAYAWGNYLSNRILFL
ncbi:hypothetical protein GXM_08040 [Nostoc sphaeroides CCNUC1]|uniref:Uncharacterized protein n=1 Tax=Nostoc sphaeroides CCNUC1 TaxID=2653204 RepID=A0A5P8WEE1_9NOSO|nr:hypothetical protein GXM_08040 [Nostoc sphaeroides CCNUC1]